MTSVMKRALQIVLGVVISAAGIAAGTLHARSKPVQNRFGQPKTVLHVVVYKFKDNVSNYDREKAISGIKDMAGKIPGIKNVWLKTSRNQIKDFSGVYAIEFTSAEAAADYAVKGLRPRSFNRFQHDARAVFWRSFGLCTSARGVSQIRGVDPSVGSGLEFFLVRLRQVHCSTLDAGHDVAGLDENGVDAKR